jgi:hypothetical protein
MKEARIWVLTNEPDYSDFKIRNTTGLRLYMGMWMRSSLRTSPNQRGSTLPFPLLRCKLVPRHGYWKILHFLNQTPMDWYSKKQATVETATFGSEFIAARTTIDQIIDLRMTLCYLGIPIWEKSYVFWDNKTVIDASSTPHAKLHKKHNTLSFF